MKSSFLLSLFLLALNLQLLAQTQATSLQNSIIGTWKMVSFSGTDAEGKPLTRDLAKVPQYKIITPTHWMYVVYDKDSLRGGGNGGTYELKGNRYVEALSDMKSDFVVKVEGNKFHQDGELTLADGGKIVLHEVYERVAEPANVNNDLVGTWELTSSYQMKDGKKVPNTGITELQIITPSHFMWVNRKNGEFAAAMFGTYTREGNKVIPVPTIASFPVGNDEKVEINLVEVTPNQMTTTGKLTFADGKTEEWGGTSRRVGKPKLAKTVSTK